MYNIFLVVMAGNQTMKFKATPGAGGSDTEPEEPENGNYFCISPPWSGNIHLHLK